MKYYMKEADTEWEIEPSDGMAWVLKRRTETGWCAIGTYRSPNEAAVNVGAKMAASFKMGARHLNRLRFVLSSWKVVERS